MFIRVYVFANDTEKTMHVYKEIIEPLQICIENYNIIKLEKYWKIEDMYVVESKIELNDKFNDNVWKSFLRNISDQWKFYGEPIYEALSSIKDEECKYMLEGVNLINVFLDE